MGFVATDIAKIPSAGYDWYLFLLTDSWKDPMQNALLDNFEQLSSSVGPDCLVVKGVKAGEFYSSLIDTQLRSLLDQNGGPVFPSLVLSSHSPKQLEDENLDSDHVVSMLIPLRLKKDIHAFLRRLSETIKKGDPEELFRNKAETKWAWIATYVELKPNFFGMGVDLNPLMDKLFDEKA